LYFPASGQHLAWGYPDQPPLTPLLAWLGNAVAPGSVWALRLPATVASGLTVLLVGMTAGEMGATRRGRLIAAATAATSGVLLLSGHMLVTNTPDLCLSALLSWLVARLIRTRDQRLLALIGLTIGIGLLNKTFFGLLVAALLAGALIAGPRRVLRGPWLFAGIAIAAALWVPNLLWQAGHGWPQLQMAQVLAKDADLGGRWGVIPFQFVLISPFLAAVWIAGLIRLLRNTEARPFRAFGIAYSLMIVVLLAFGGNAYYLAGGYPALLAAGAIATDGWLTRAVSRLRAWVLAVGTVLSAAFFAMLGLPVTPVSQLAHSPVLAVFKEPGEQIGWPQLAEEIGRVYHSLTPDQRSRAVAVTANYGEAGALAVYGPALGLSPVYSGHNGHADWGPPPDFADVVLVIGGDPKTPPPWTRTCRQLREVGSIDNGFGVPNEEQGAPIRLCDGMIRPWSVIWPELRVLS
jgi:4-amino-4-deoxy-L-arabinose transferase-like glycosyltransferase